MKDRKISFYYYLTPGLFHLLKPGVTCPSTTTDLSYVRQEFSPVSFLFLPPSTSTNIYTRNSLVPLTRVTKDKRNVLPSFSVKDSQPSSRLYILLLASRTRVHYSLWVLSRILNLTNNKRERTTDLCLMRRDSWVCICVSVCVCIHTFILFYVDLY